MATNIVQLRKPAPTVQLAAPRVAVSKEIQALYRLYGSANVKVCTNGTIYRRSKESQNWILVGGAA